MVSFIPAVDVSAVDTQRSTTAGPLSRSNTVRWGFWLLLVLVVPAVIVEVRSALTRPFWYDELCTAVIAALRTPSAIWGTLIRGVDTQQPFFYLITGAGRYLFADDHLAFRFPALVGYFVVPFALYAFVSRRAGAVAGLVAALVPFLSGAQMYASEARPYGFVLGCFAVALVSWQRVELSRRWGIALALSLTAAVASHYYAVLVLPGFAAAEIVRWYRTREFRLSAWLPVAVSVAPIALALPLMRVIKELYGAHFWSHGNMVSLAVAYSTLTGAGMVLTGGILVVLLGVLLLRAVDRPAWLRAWLLSRSADAVPPEEALIAAFLLCVPVAAYAALKVTQGGLMLRYVLPSALGLAVSMGFVSAWLGRNVAAVVLAVLIVNHGLTSLVRGRIVYHAQSRSAAANSLAPQVEQWLRDFPEPRDVVISSGVDYIALAYYATAEAKQRMVTLVDPPGAVQAIDTDTVDVELPLLQPYLPMNVQSFTQFRGDHRRFLLFSSATNHDWWPARLSREGNLVTLRREQGDFRLYEVELRP